MRFNLTIVFFFYILLGFSQNTETTNALKLLQRKGEVSFKFTVQSSEEINTLTKIISIDEQTMPGSKVVFAYANKEQFIKFLTLNYRFEVVNNLENLANGVSMYDSHVNKKKLWDAYPTYAAYVSQMQDYETAYPALCKLYKIGVSIQGRKILFVKITGNQTLNSLKPRIMLTSSMHGDELTGYVLMLRMIDYLLTTYGSSTKTTSLLDNFEIWINPLANPDGTYAGGENTVAGAKRTNANNVDLNRNFPDFVAGAHPDGVSAWQPENIAMMRLADSLHFVESINFHGGAEVLNYPWDTKTTRHADENWWQYVAKNYADTAFAHSFSGYLTDVSNNGYTNGHDWYEIQGGRQDYMNFFHHCREFTLEISRDKTPNGNELPALWEANYRSIINYIQEAANGVQGTVTDSITGAPLYALLNIPGHDADGSAVFSELSSGNFFRPTFQGQYTMQISAAGYKPKAINFSSQNSQINVQNIKLTHYSADAEIIAANNDFQIFPNPASDKLNIQWNSISAIPIECNLYNMIGENIYSNKQTISETEKSLIIDLPMVNSGMYTIQIITKSNTFIKKIVITK